MNRVEARAALRAQVLGDARIVEAHLAPGDDDCWIYMDYTARMQYTLTQVEGGTIQVAALSFKEVTRRMNEELDRPDLQTYYEEDLAFDAMDICPDCGCVFPCLCGPEY